MYGLRRKVQTFSMLPYRKCGGFCVVDCTVFGMKHLEEDDLGIDYPNSSLGITLDLKKILHRMT
jgi:hypothetical protein